jgi:hypothetical protein
MKRRALSTLSGLGGPLSTSCSDSSSKGVGALLGHAV